jgi:hypothetical protein
MKLKTAILAYLILVGVVGAASLWPDDKDDPVLASFVRTYAQSENAAPARENGAREEDQRYVLADSHFRTKQRQSLAELSKAKGE